MNFTNSEQLFTDEEIILLSTGLRIALFSKDDDPMYSEDDSAHKTYTTILKKLQTLSDNEYIKDMITKEIEQYRSLGNN
ncbi:MAG: hypothetical protein QNJ32_29600 [Xenococcaceae cyanobacterium MO_167.B27]|nr:hypothetical protein [Xenococcaceae cyanobacterium MO_167.B27]